MRKLILLVLLMSLVPVAAIAQSAFDGTWKIDLNKVKMPEKPDVYSLQAGMYHCKTCVPTVDVKADGQDHQIAGHPYYDSVNIKVVDDRTIEETDKKNGKTVATSKTTVSADGKTASFEFADSSNTSSDPVTGKGEITRVAAGPAGSHAMSGSWRTAKLENISENALSVTYKIEGDSLSMSSPTGQSYTAKLDGTDAPYKGDPGTNGVSVKKLGKDAIEETDKRDGKVISVARITVAGKTMNIAVTDKLHGTTMQFVAEKQ